MFRDFGLLINRPTELKPRRVLFHHIGQIIGGDFPTFLKLVFPWSAYFPHVVTEYVEAVAD